MPTTSGARTVMGDLASCEMSDRSLGALANGVMADLSLRAALDHEQRLTD